MTRLIADSPNAAKAVLDRKRLTYAEAEIVQTKIQHRPGEIARLASRLRKGTVYINYAYCGLEPETNTLVFFGVTEVGKRPQFLRMPWQPGAVELNKSAVRVAWDFCPIRPPIGESSRPFLEVTNQMVFVGL